MDKIQKIRREVERIQLYSQSETLKQILDYIDKVEKEPDGIWKPADGDDLPEIDREVIALTQPYPNDEHLRVVFAHRTNKYTKVWNSDLGEEQVVEIERYDKGGWNQPNVKWWLDCNMDSIFKK